MSMEKLDFGVKMGNISETEQFKDVVSIEYLYKVAYGLSFSIKIDDLKCRNSRSYRLFQGH